MNENSAANLESHIMTNFDHSPLNEDIVVSKVLTGKSLMFQVTFVGPSIIQSAQRYLVDSFEKTVPGF